MEIITALQALHLQPVPIVMTLAVCVALGAFWYSPNVFGGAWARALQIERHQMKGNPLQYLGTIFVSAIMILCIAIFLAAANITTVQEGMRWSFLAWLGLIATSHFSGVIWARKPVKVYIIDVTYLLLAIWISTTLLIVWRT